MRCFMSFKQISLKDFTNNSENSPTNHLIFFGDISSSLTQLQNNSIDCAITSPPYWNQRDYGFNGQIGNEPTVDEYIKKLTNSFSILRSKMSDKGVFFLNIGDKYISKYGNTPLGMIPYKLVKSMMSNGWLLQDTLIWFKPNHMPSSVKNRFTNTYEPVFVLVVNKDNYYTSFINSDSYSNVITVPLQQNTYKHIATFPEKLIISLISLLNLPTNATILDPFAGSGTTTLAIQNCNEKNNNNYSSISIEAKPEFVDIIKSRCNISKNNIRKIDYCPHLENKFSITATDLKPLNCDKFTTLPSIEYNSPLLIIKTYFKNDFDKIHNEINNEDFINSLDDNGIFLLQMPFLDPFTLINLSKNSKWIIRNIVLRQEGKICYPTLFLVKDIKSVHYKFNLDAIREEHLHKKDEIYKKTEFIGYKVLKTNSLFKSKLQGIIDRVISFDEFNFPRFVYVLWENGEQTIEEVTNFTETSNQLYFFCPFCNTNLEIYFQNRKIINCLNCNKSLWNDYNSIPVLKIQDIQPPKNNLNSDEAITENKKIEIIKSFNKTDKEYKGKFTLEDKINRGQSPGARLSVTEQYFFVTRYYTIRYGLFAKYLNLFLKHNGISKSALTKRFPLEYKHTIGHWLRYDMGSSLPKIEDLLLLEDVLNVPLDLNYKKLITKIGLKLQSVLNDKQGKNPGDFLILSSNEYIKFFNKIVS